MIVLGVSGGLSHDPAAAIVVDGRLIAAAEEERFIRKKRARFELPIHAIHYCLAAAGIGLRDVDMLAAGWNPELAPDAEQPRDYLQAIVDHDLLRGELPPVTPVDHHLAHAYASWAGSGFIDGAVIVADGRGEAAATSIYIAKDRSLERKAVFGIRDSLGYLYGATTRYLGFGDGAEGKVMGLASYGKPIRDFPITLDPSGYSVDLSVPDAPWDEYGRALQKSWATWLAGAFGPRPVLKHAYDVRAGRIRASHDDVLAYADVAASAQSALESVMTHLAKTALSWTPAKNLILGGGVALNCSSNGKLVNLAGLDRMYIFPAAGDAGTAVGAALWMAEQMGDRVEGEIEHAFFGPSFDDGEIRQTLTELGVSARQVDAAGVAANLILDGKVLGWFQGRAEIGPRALGHRSILANPQLHSMLERVNRIKGRELWRPLAPSALPATAEKMLGTDKGSPFMLRAFPMVDDMRMTLPAVSHVDGTTRAQVVSSLHNEEYARLLGHLGDATGYGVVMNTSFNDETEPIVQTPRDALRTFYSTGLDALVIGNWLVEK
ncbi:carbamoyltransferase [Nonomuraea sp. NPDC050328]|uniref:carbamoyltransferase n=1 Tax=Nonomuraea sp. NPDC050328 TaxID=3364361 RepID=UPI00379FE41D